MVTSNTGMPIFVGCKVKVQSIAYVTSFFENNEDNIPLVIRKIWKEMFVVRYMR